MKDPIVDEVRKYRMEHARKFRGDLAAICADLRAVQAASGHEVVRLSPRRAGRLAGMPKQSAKKQLTRTSPSTEPAT
ncbi:MAG: hypothetical protein AUJ92_04255 [Armatimonadetes bacterium CG2_30_59_28]|nr:MAG: hypothetical protein AUJ92_04255 [Armatimonadetes bacterium CG2_30_59_28]PIU65799.1 MAG: hypothetical protein COS85_07365 [Armatimonadetes bacterium CG07_land_8_20_14_0_80_59_28]PIX41764.1 MAG: hypothetical protein COZ56_11095 [Armatimonadetes bacterium CG_4_8_14_3_um_filter_58_9]PIY40335.1 MAG: hypothetical protein COZ05_17705 [Armatimonadetes bacterium CG_4_10_14_3_um_filter_59_10]PJB66806.1 MAG: hypothetical protein CO095_12705 [Armatimonadetes bacterium CG_4_9_14_3_um_filter_58_7]